MRITKINEEVYGKKEKWYKATSHNFTTYTPFFGGSDERLTTGVSYGKLAYNRQIDSSICMFGISGDCDIFCHNAIQWNPNKDPIIKTEQHDTGQIMYISSVGGETSVGQTYDNLSISTRDTTNGIRWSPDGTRPDYPAYAFYQSIAVDFCYNQAIICINVTCFDTNFNNYKLCTLQEYIDTYKTNYPYLVGIYPVIFKGSLTNRVAGSGGLWRPIPYTILPYIKTERSSWNSGLITYFDTLNFAGIGVTKKDFFRESGYSNTTISYYNGSPDRWKLREVTYYNKKALVPVFTGSIDDIYKQASYWGLYFTPDENVAKTATLGEKCTDNNVFLPVIDEGVLKGEYKRGAESTELFNSKLDYDIREKSGYTGIDNIDPTKYADKISLNKPKLTSAGAFNTFYALTENELKSFANELWTADESKFNQIIQGLMLMGENPMNGIISLQLYPFSLLQLANSSVSQRIQIGRTKLDTTATKIDGLDGVIDLGSINLRNYFDSFFDYEPYSTATLYIPYCGSIQISLNDTIGKTISIKMIIDYNSGICTGVVFSDGIPIVYKNGVIGQQISVTGTDTATMASNAISSSLNMLNNATNFIAGGKDVSSTIQNSANLLASSFDYSAMRTIYQAQGANSSQINMYQPQKPHIIINLAEFDVADDFGKYHGFRCDFYDFINSLNGYVETDTPILTNINATEDEKNIIIELMRGGFYV